MRPTTNTAVSSFISCRSSKPWRSFLNHTMKRIFSRDILNFLVISQTFWESIYHSHPTSSTQLFPPTEPARALTVLKVVYLRMTLRASSSTSGRLIFVVVCAWLWQFCESAQKKWNQMNVLFWWLVYVCQYIFSTSVCSLLFALPTSRFPLHPRKCFPLTMILYFFFFFLFSFTSGLTIVIHIIQNWQKYPRVPCVKTSKIVVNLHNHHHFSKLFHSPISVPAVH